MSVIGVGNGRLGRGVVGWMALAGAAGTGLVGSADGAVVPVAQIPAISANAAGFAPAGWTVEKRIAGDLNGDGRSDRAIVLVQAPGAESAYGAADGSRALVLVLAQTSVRFRRAGVAPRLLGCRTCGGAFWGASSMPVTVRITRGAVIVRQTFGSRELTDLTHRIRWDPRRSRFRLVGLDSVVTDRVSGRSVSVSTNHLTRRQIRVTRQGAVIVARTDRVVPVAPRPIAGLVFGNLRP